MVDARYDGLAEWYDDYLKQPFYDDVPEHVYRLVVQEPGFVSMPVVEPGYTLAYWRHEDGL